MSPNPPEPGKPYDFGPDLDVSPIEELVEYPGPYIFPRGPDVRPRLDIADLLNDHRQKNLFILALSMFQSIHHSSARSWYQIAGIHGAPYETWNGVEPVLGANHLSGYCPQGSTLWPRWHRVYLLMFEDEICRLAHLIASMFGDPDEASRYREAAQKLRLPFWDWTVESGWTRKVRRFFGRCRIHQYGPRGTQEIHNPLFSYVFQPGTPTVPLSGQQQTMRARAWVIPYNPHSIIKKRLPQLRGRLYSLFCCEKPFNSAMVKTWSVQDQQSASWDSIEAIHGSVQVACAEGGHMGHAQAASFDPLFLLLHVSTDRLVAMWQALNPAKWMEPTAAAASSYSTPCYEMNTSSSPLKPFIRLGPAPDFRRMFWDSDMARYTSRRGYTYPGISGTDPTMGAPPFPDQASWEGVTDVIKRWGVSMPHKSDTQWVANCLLDTHLVDGPVTIELAVDDEPFEFLDFFTGTQSPESGPLVIAAAVPLSWFLQEGLLAGTIPSQEREVVKDYLGNRVQTLPPADPGWIRLDFSEVRMLKP
ncbi:Tyrosinase-like protein [Hapsidospora chrysogenum ATCC 11550]|uniref:tyrosinase n=1 Tax=Hapsidospora chrysogenum (strain ATCC 11550 / CBS 779.69 / DSM 880 / IAM 14645 / JCM 23072 / IMI 49137) TaxID=857340 RepID=A0A086T0Z5_HAPC1|nr:Tyrosinase-like protein [Hapsidospora chrysogenum ATCC 11550]